MPRHARRDRPRAPCQRRCRGLPSKSVGAAWAPAEDLCHLAWVLPRFSKERHQMRKVPLSESLRIIAQGSLNWRAGRPIVVSFEVTDSCTCFCKHGDHGGVREMSRDMKPADYRRYMDVLKPVVVQVSGGEPLMRDDLEAVVRNIKDARGLPFIILVSNWSLMTKARYLALREAGVDEFCVSLDFPGARMDEFRGPA